MTRFEKKAAVVLALALLILLLAVQGHAQAPVLVNGDFEGAFTPRGAGEVVVAEGWDPAWVQGDGRQCRAPCYRPEYQPETEIVEQGKSQRWFTTFARQFAAIYQRVNVRQGQWYEFSCAVYNISEPDGRMEVFVGINPWGGDPFHRTIIWGQGYVKPYREWARVSVMAQAWGDTITVAAGANNSFATKNNAAYWDNCTIQHVGGPVPSPTWMPTPFPTTTPCPTCAPGGSCPTIQEIATVVADRPPVRWPR